MCIVTDKLSYAPKENIIFTVEATGNNPPSATITYPVFLAVTPTPNGVHPTAVTYVTVHYVGAATFAGNGTG
jgi:hypothetical protein